VVTAGAREQDGEADGAEHEDDCGVSCQPGEKIGCATRAKGSLRTLAAEGSGEVGGLALLEEDDADEKERDDDVKDNEKNDHEMLCNLLDRRKGPGNVWIGAEEGT
jgi:hypothetical protein